MYEKNFEVLNKDKGTTTTFMVQIMFCQNSSVQGRISWVEAKRSIYFRSLLEMIILMTEALEDTETRSWQEQASKFEVE